MKALAPLIVLLLLASLIAAQGGRAQIMEIMRRSHADANVPAAADFNRLLRRDLRLYFEAARNQRALAIEAELLREEPTQSGIAYPKFYAWIRIAEGVSPTDRGAVRVAAIERARFEVTDFVSELTMRSDPERINEVFPPAVCEKINARLRALPERAGQPRGLVIDLTDSL